MLFRPDVVYFCAWIANSASSDEHGRQFERAASCASVGLRHLGLSAAPLLMACLPCGSACGGLAEVTITEGLAEVSDRAMPGP
jgi:hypothetical protein